MFPKAVYVYNNSMDDYHVLIGNIVDNKLEGYGKEIIQNGEEQRMTFGEFKNGVLNGLAVKFINNNCVEAGLYIDNKYIDVEEFKKDANQKMIGEANRMGYDYANCVLYYHGDDPNNLNGYALLACEEMVVHFITGKQYVKGERSCYQFIKYENNQEVGFSTYKCFVKDKGYYFNHFIYEKKNVYLELITDNRHGSELFEWEKVEVSEGVTKLSSQFHKANSSVILYLPKSIKTLKNDVIYSKNDYLLEVYYSGTKEEWNHIEKGIKETYGTEDWYGYYYHNSERYGVSQRFKDWAKNAIHILIHCSDGDIETYDRSYD